MSSPAFFPHPFPVQTPQGEGYALYVTPAPMWENDAWCVALDDGRIMHFSTIQLRGVGNGTYDMPRPHPPVKAPTSGETPSASVAAGDLWQALGVLDRHAAGIVTLLKAAGMPDGVDSLSWLRERLAKTEFCKEEGGCLRVGWDWSKRIDGCPGSILREELARRGASLDPGPRYVHLRVVYSGLDPGPRCRAPGSPEMTDHLEAVTCPKCKGA